MFVHLCVITHQCTTPTTGRVNQRKLCVLRMAPLTYMLSVYCGFSDSLIAHCLVGFEHKTLESSLESFFSVVQNVYITHNKLTSVENTAVL